MNTEFMTQFFKEDIFHKLETPAYFELQSCAILDQFLFSPQNCHTSLSSNVGCAMILCDFYGNFELHINMLITILP